MKLDYECVRDVMRYLESALYIVENSHGSIEYCEVWLEKICQDLPHYPQTVIYYTLSNLEQAGYISASKQWTGDGLNMYCVNYITFEGHEFLEKIKSDTVWKKTLSTAGKVGNFSLQMLAKIAEGVATAYLNKELL